MFELHFSDLPVPAIIFICGAWITISQSSMEKGFLFIVGAFFIYVVFIIVLMMLRGEIR